MVMGLLTGGPKRFTSLRREIEGVSQKRLTQTLRRLERSGLVQRMVFAEVPPRVEYRLTPLGRTLCGPLAVLQKWAEDHHPEVLAAQEAYDRRGQGEAAGEKEG